jgi:hypothetical protein
MELDELKNIWNKNKADFQQKDEVQLAAMLKGSSRSIVDKLKRSVWFELILTILVGMALLVYAFAIPAGALKWATIAIILLLVAYSVYYVKKLLLLNRFNTADDNLKANLEKLVASLTGYLKFYKKSYTILYPIYFALSILFGALEMGSDRFLAKLSDPKTVLYLLALTVVVTFITLAFTNWLLRKLYGRHLEKLEALLDELNRGEDIEES